MPLVSGHLVGEAAQGALRTGSSCGEWPTKLTNVVRSPPRAEPTRGASGLLWGALCGTNPKGGVSDEHPASYRRGPGGFPYYSVPAFRSPGPQASFRPVFRLVSAEETQ